jgi:hypothetical protein
MEIGVFNVIYNLKTTQKLFLTFDKMVTNEALELGSTD